MKKYKSSVITFNYTMPESEGNNRHMEDMKEFIKARIQLARKQIAMDERHLKLLSVKVKVQTEKFDWKMPKGNK